MLINWIRHTKSESELFLYTRNLKNKRYTGFLVQNHLLKLCSSAVNSQGLFCNQKVGVLKISGIIFFNHRRKEKL